MYTFTEMLTFFFVYSFFGWCAEVAYAVLDTGKFNNRGFLYGPVCPIYGFGMITILLLVTPVADNLFLLFIYSMILTTVIEFFTGFILEKIFKAKWWDYSELPFNIKGYICLKFSLIWGIACTFTIRIIHSLVQGFVGIIPKLLLNILLIIFFAILLSDIIITICTILKLKNRIKLMDKLGIEIKELSDKIAYRITERILEAKEKNEEIKDKIEDKLENLEKIHKEHIEEIKDKYNQLLNKKSIWQTRLINQIKFINYQDIIEKIKEFNKK